MRMPAAKKKKKKKGPRKKLNTKACDKIIKTTQIGVLNEKWLPSSGKQTTETKSPDGKDGENDKERSKRKRDGKKSITPTNRQPYMVTNCL